MTDYDWAFIALLIIWLWAKLQFGVDLTRVFVGAVFVLVANIWRLTKLILSLGKKNDGYIAVPKPRPLPDSVFSIAAQEKIKPGQIVVGYDGRQPIITDMKRDHSLICGITGGGKTYLLHNMLVQWYSLGQRFSDNFEVYLIDLKGDDEERVWCWEACVDGYVRGGEADSIPNALSVLDNLSKSGGNPEKHTIIIIDEVYPLTRHEEAVKVLRALASTFRSKGSLILITQYARFSVVDTIIRYNLNRRICFRGGELAHIRKAMDDNAISKEMNPTKPGEFLIADSQYPQIRRGKVRKVKIDGPNSDIDLAVNLSVSDLGQRDKRVRLYLAACGALKKGRQLPAINTIKDEVEMKQKEVMYAYRNFCQAGAVELTARNTYILTKGFEHGYINLRRYIQAGSWQDGPAQSSRGK